MGDLDSILQDFSYLKSLEHKNQAPKKLHPKLYLPDPSVVHVVEHIFESTGEAVFDRIFNRPLGYRCFTEFVSHEYGKTNKAAVTLLTFNNKVKDIVTAPGPEANGHALTMKADFLNAPEIVAANVFSDEAINAAFAARLEKLAASVSRSSKPKNVNIKEYFTPFLPQMRAYLSKEPWEAFKKSASWIRYCQLKHLELNMKISERDFDVHRILGRGGFGEVFGCRKHDTGAMFAMKKLDKRRLKSKHQETSAVHERNVLAEMHSKFVTNLKYAFHDKDTLYLILDLMEGGDLSWHLKHRDGPFEEKEARFYSAEIILGLAHIHSRNMIYRDLKPANILLDAKGHARISDMGLVRDMSKSLPTSECGTHGYMSPEVLTPDTPYDQGADWWSLGCVIYQLLCGYSPFRGPERIKVTREEMDARTLSGTVTYPDIISADAKDLISQLLDRNPKTRLGCRGKGALELKVHPWFDTIDWSAMLDHKVNPTYVPPQNQVNAHDVYEIDRFDTWDMRRIVVTPEDNRKYYSNFDHIMSHYWQEEILSSVYDQMISRAHSLEQKAAEAIAARAVEDASVLKGAAMQGYLLKKGGLMGSWRPRYFALFDDRLEFRLEQRQGLRRSVPLASVTDVAERDDKGVKTIVISSDFPRPLEVRAKYESDHKVWLSLLRKASKRVGGEGSASPERTRRVSANEDTLDVRAHQPSASELPEDDEPTEISPCEDGNHR